MWLCSIQCINYRYGTLHIGHFHNLRSDSDQHSGKTYWFIVKMTELLPTYSSKLYAPQDKGSFWSSLPLIFQFVVLCLEYDKYLLDEWTNECINWLKVLSFIFSISKTT